MPASARLFLLALMVCLVAAPVGAQSEAAPIDAKPGQTIEILDDQERTIRGKVIALSPQSIRLSVDDTATEIHFDRITRIVRRGDSVASGALTGLAVGAGVGLIGTTLDNCEPRGFSVCFSGPAYVIAGTLFFGAVGAGIGAGVDALIRGERVIYQRDASPQARVIPVLGRQVRGARVAVSW